MITGQPAIDALTDSELLDWLESELRASGRGDIELHPYDWQAVRAANLIANWEITDKSYALRWPDTEGKAHDLRFAIRAAIVRKQAR